MPGSDRIPPLHTVQIRLPAGTPVELDLSVSGEWQRLNLSEQVSGRQIAVGVGSRGVVGIVSIVCRIVELIKAAGGYPFIVPAMGSHGGATSQGQLEVLAGLGIVEGSIGCPLRATMDTVVVGETDTGLPLHVDRHVAEADGLILINRVKIHTDFHGPHESGLLKMLAIGLGKETGAQMLHSYGLTGLRDYMPQVARALLPAVSWIAGFATVEDGYHRPVHLEAFTVDDVIAGEQRLLELARSLAPQLPVDELDVLVVDHIGKEISGAGMDTNVIGRLRIAGEEEPPAPRIHSIVVLDVTDASHGNALGVGLADFTVQRLLSKIDFEKMTTNVFTSGFLERGRLPLVYNTDQDAINAAITHALRGSSRAREQVRLMRIRNTLVLEELAVSPALLDEVKKHESFIKAGDPQPLRFEDGHLF
jgi:hypothetical protein